MTQPTPPERDNLGLALERTEARLAEKLEEACVPETRDVSDESTAELAKLSDSLLAAAHAAKECDLASATPSRKGRSGRCNGGWDHSRVHRPGRQTMARLGSDPHADTRREA